MAFWDFWIGRDSSTEDIINRFALFLGFLAMAVRGLGFLVVTWTTVVLLGGFVSVLPKEDFWSLTVITLVQSLGVFDFLLKEKASDIVDSLGGLMTALFVALARPLKKEKINEDEDEDEYEYGSGLPIARLLLALVLWVVQFLVLAIILCPLAVLYLLGLYISTGISVWRLREHDHGNNTEGTANLKPALNVLYFIALAQGVVFIYKEMYDLVARDGFKETMARRYSLDKDLVSDYVDETVTGCTKDPSFAKGRDLITHAVDLLMESKDYLSGVRILANSQLEGLLPNQQLTNHAVIQRLLEILHPGTGSPYREEIRQHAASAVLQVADRIFLEQFPGGIQIISTLLETFEEYCWRCRPCEVYYRCTGRLPQERNYIMYKPEILEPCSDTNWRRLHDYKRLVVQGLRILQKLAAHEDNCRVISHTGGLLSKIMAPLISEHRLCLHDEWCCMAEESVGLLTRLAAAPGETRRKLLLDISSNMDEAAISNLKFFLECPKCELWLKRQTVIVLLDLSVDTSSIAASGSSSTMFSWILLHIFLLADKCSSTRYVSMLHWVKRSSHIRNLAAEKLLAMLSSQQSEGTRMSMPEAVRAVITSITGATVEAENSTYRLQAVQFLMHLCRGYNEDGEFVVGVKEAIVNVMPEVLKQILVSGTTGKNLQAIGQVSNIAHLAAPGSDLENGSVPQGSLQERVLSSSLPENGDEQHERSKLRKALISLFVEGYDKDYLPPQWSDMICSEHGMRAESFVYALVRKLRREINADRPPFF